MDENLSQKAIDLALNCKWNEAVKVNKKILKLNINDIDTLNRLSRSYYEIGDTIKANKTSLKVLKIDPGNNIAIKAIEKYKNSSKNKTNENLSFNQNIDPSVFIEEPGRTKLINLINVGSINTCSCLDSGDEIFIIPHTHKVSLTNSEGKYVGRLPDDLSSKLRRFIKGGNEYKVFVKSVEGKNLKVIVKEVARGLEFKNIQSFPREISESVAENFSDSDI